MKIGEILTIFHQSVRESHILCVYGKGGNVPAGSYRTLMFTLFVLNN